MKNINKVIREELNKKYQINESIKKIMNESKEKRFGLAINFFNDLIEEGYTNKELEGVIEEGWDWLKNIFSDDVKTPGQSQSKGDGFFGKMGGGAISQVKEFVVAKFLSYLGFTGPLAEALSTAVTEMNIKELIALFRGRQNCVRYGPNVADALAEAMVTYLSHSTRPNSTAFNFLRNTVFEYIKSSQFGEISSKFICDNAYKAKTKLSGIS